MPDVLSDLLFFFLRILYVIVFIWKYGQTPGKKLLKLKVVSSSYQPLGLGTAFFRESVWKVVSSLVYNIGIYWVLIDGKRQAWHDKLAKTIVVKTNNEGALIPVDSEEVVTTGQKLLFAALFLVTVLALLYLYFILTLIVEV